VNILLVEDDLDLAGALAGVLAPLGHHLVCCGDGMEALVAARRRPFDAMILDLGVPTIDGLQLLQRLRDGGSELPVLVLTARGSVGDRIAGLNVGADDYLAKPFVVGELLARIKAVMRRSHPVSAQTLVIGSLRVDRARRRAWDRSVEIPLTATEFDLLELLTEAPGTIVSRDTIARALYGRDTTAYERAIDVHVSHLRKKLGDIDGVSIRTIRGSGYMVEPHA